MPACARKERRLEKTLARAAIFRLLARAFAYPAPGHMCAVDKMFAEIDKARTPDRGAQRLTRLRRTWRLLDEAECAREYARLFLGNGPVSLHETAHGDGRRIAGRPAELADIGGFYAAFGFALSDGDPDLPDHLCAELEFYSLLLVKEAYALSRGWLAKARIARTAAKTFLEQHLGRWTGALRTSLEENNAFAYLDLADTVAIAVEAECKRLRAQPTPFAGRLPPDAMQDESLVCPHGAAATH